MGAASILPVRDHYYCYAAAWQLTNIKKGSCKLLLRSVDRQVPVVGSGDGTNRRRYSALQPLRHAFNNPYKFSDLDRRNSVSDWLVRNGFLPHGASVYTPIPGASRGDAQVVSLIAGSAVAGGAAAAAVTVGAPAMISAAAESASMGTGMAAQQTANVVVGAVATATEATSAAVVGATVRTMVAVDAEVSMVAAYAGANAAAASNHGLAAAAATPAAATEFAAGVMAGAAGITSPASSLSNAAGGSLGSAIREDLDWDKK